MPVSLLETKLYAPQPKGGLISRPRLVERMDAALAGGVRLILVSAPAGYGKTTAVSAWVEGLRQKGSGATAWLSLDEQDSDPYRFWSYVVAALERAATGVAQGARAYLQTQPPSVRQLLTHLINRAAGAPAEEEQGPLALVLDDYHLIDSIDIQEKMAFLLAHLPASLRVVIITRVDPPLPVARMLARGEAISIRARDLRFDVDEATQFFKAATTSPVALSPAQVAALVERTEGWPAGLQFAGLQFAGLQMAAADGEEDEVASFVSQFSGMQRPLVDYVLEEILARQPEGIQAFLLQTSVLRRFCAALCERVAPPGEGAGGVRTTASEIIDYLERANLFVTPLDHERQWYRYHHLFADLLRARLRQRWPERVDDLQRRAAQWHREKGLVAEAIAYALEADDFALAADMLEQHTRALLVGGDIHTLLRAIQALPEAVASDKPWLTIYQAWALTLGGHYEEAAALAKEVAVRAGDSEEDAALCGHVAAIRAFQAATSTVGEEGLAQAREALALLPADALWSRGLATWALGYALRMQGHLREAAPYFETVIGLGHRRHDLQAIASAQYDLAMVRRRQGRLREAQALLEEVLTLAEEQGAQEIGYLGRVEAGLANTLVAQNELEAARRHVQRSLRLNEAWHNPNHDHRTWLALAQLALAQGDVAEATSAWHKAEAVARQFTIVPVLRDQARALRAQLWPAQHDLAGAARWLEENDYGEGDLARRAPEVMGAPHSFLAAVRLHLALARARNRPPVMTSVTQVRKALATVVARSRQAGHGELTTGALVLQAMACRLQGAEDEATAALQEALRLAAPQGFTRVFVDEGPALRDMLAHVAAQRDQDEQVRRFAQSLLDAPGETPDGASAGLVEPLTEREMEVLGLLAQGLTNRQIAERLFIARGTVKAHAASIYGKLDVHNRTRAVTRARELGLL